MYDDIVVFVHWIIHSW